ncbi:hypothetical protein Tco_0520440 [Tanacetum coccineum]
MGGPSTPRDPMSDKPSNGLDIAVFFKRLIEEFGLLASSNQVQARGRDAANAMVWNDFKALLTTEFCPSNEIEKLETTQPATIQADILITGILTDEAVRSGTLAKASEKRKERDEANKSEVVRKDEKKAKRG